MVNIKTLIWNVENVKHITRHKVKQSEVEEIYSADSITDISYEKHIRVIDKTKAGRFITVILAPKESSNYYVVTARPLSRKERKIYSERQKVK